MTEHTFPLIEVSGDAYQMGYRARGASHRSRPKVPVMDREADR